MNYVLHLTNFQYRNTSMLLFLKRFDFLNNTLCRICLKSIIRFVEKVRRKEKKFTLIVKVNI